MSFLPSTCVLSSGLVYRAPALRMVLGNNKEVLYYFLLMSFLGRQEAFILFIGDALFLGLSLWLALFFRSRGVPTGPELYLLVTPFSFIFALWLLVFFIADLYGRRAFATRSALSSVLFQTQIINAVLAVFFFYFIPYFGVAPKTILFLSITISFFFIYLWRTRFFKFFQPSRKEGILVIGTSSIIEETVLGLAARRTSATMFRLREVKDDLAAYITENNISTVVMPIFGPYTPAGHLKNLLFSHVRFVDASLLYEELFGRVPTASINDSWVLQYLSQAPRRLYDIWRRVLDIIISVPLGLVSLVIYPFVIIAIYLEDKGSPFIVQKRLGRGGKEMYIVKFRTMKESDEGVWHDKNGDSRVTRVGKFLRRSRIDELPQLWNVLGGKLSLIGPRPELPKLATLYEKEIPYYHLRHLVTPGLSGWAQIHHDSPPHSIEETKEKLAYDLYYLKHRSIMLDMEIALKTLRILLSRTGI